MSELRKSNTDYSCFLMLFSVYAYNNYENLIINNFYGFLFYDYKSAKHRQNGN